MTSTALRIHGWYGDPVVVSAAREFGAELYREAATLGFGTSLAEIESIIAQTRHIPDEVLWDESRSVKSSAAAFESVAMVVSIFVGTASASWAVEKALDALWDRLKRALRKLAASRLDNSASDGESNDKIIIQTYYYSRSVLVEIQVPLHGTDDTAEKAADADKESRGVAMNIAPGHILRYVVADTTTYRLDVFSKNAFGTEHRKDDV